MIKYQLRCEHDHGFDAWFRDSAAFDAQHRAHLVSCPQCGTSRVDKALMAPSIPAKANKAADAGGPARVFRPDPREAKLRAMLKEVRDHVVNNADYVGDKFAEEARKIHYQEAENRGIYGEADPDEALELLEEGIAVHPLPVIPDEQN